MTAADQSTRFRTPLWGRLVGWLLVAAVLVVSYLAVSPHEHHEVHPDCDQPEHSCVITQWTGGVAPTLGTVLLLVLSWKTEYLRRDPVNSRAAEGAPAWAWAQGPPSGLAAC